MLDFLVAFNGYCQMDMNLSHDAEVLDVFEGNFIEGLVGSERSPIWHSTVHVDVTARVVPIPGTVPSRHYVITPISS